VKILHVVPTYLPATRYGGPIFAVHGLCKALAARRHSVDVFTTNVDGEGVSDVRLDQPTTIDGVNVHYFPSSLKRIYFSPAMRRRLHEHVAEFDIVHAHSVFLWPTAAASRAAHAHNVPYVISPRGMLVPELIRKKSRIAKRAWISLIERRNFTQAAAIHFTSEQEHEDARRLGIATPRAIVIPNGVDVPPLRDAPRDAATVLFLGRVNWKKGLDRLIAAIALVPNARLIIAGGDEENYTAQLPRHDRVEFVGEVSGDAKEKLMRSATMLVLPSLSENFGNSVLEAMAHAMPVIVTRGVGLAADVEASDCGIVTSGEPPPLAAAITRLLDDETLQAEMGRRGRALVEKRFTWDRVAAEMEAAYSLIDEQDRRS
jgi:glycosyltransferase involved in cell wall biosynthesis